MFNGEGKASVHVERGASCFSGVFRKTKSQGNIYIFLEGSANFGRLFEGLKETLAILILVNKTLSNYSCIICACAEFRFKIILNYFDHLFGKVRQFLGNIK